MAKYEIQEPSIQVYQPTRAQFGDIKVPESSKNFENLAVLSDTIKNMASTVANRQDLIAKEKAVDAEMKEKFKSIKGLNKYVEGVDLDDNTMVEAAIKAYEKEQGRLGKLRGAESFTYTHAAGEEKVRKISSWIDEGLEKLMPAMTNPSSNPMDRINFDQAVAKLFSPNENGEHAFIGESNTGETVTSNIKNLNPLEQIMLSEEIAKKESVVNQSINKVLKANTIESKVSMSSEKLYNLVDNFRDFLTFDFSGTEQAYSFLGEDNAVVRKLDDLRQKQLKDMKQSLLEEFKKEADSILAVGGEPKDAILAIVQDIVQDNDGEGQYAQIDFINNFVKLLQEDFTYRVDPNTGEPVLFAASGTETNTQLDAIRDAAIKKIEVNQTESASFVDMASSRLEQEFIASITGIDITDEDAINTLVGQYEKKLAKLIKEENEKRLPKGLSPIVDSDARKFITRLNAIPDKILTNVKGKHTDPAVEHIAEVLYLNDTISVHHGNLSKHINETLQGYNDSMAEVSEDYIPIKVTDFTVDQIKEIYDAAKSKGDLNDSQSKRIRDAQAELEGREYSEQLYDERQQESRAWSLSEEKRKDEKAAAKALISDGESATNRIYSSFSSQTTATSMRNKARGGIKRHLPEMNIVGMSDDELRDGWSFTYVMQRKINTEIKKAIGILQSEGGTGTLEIKATDHPAFTPEEIETISNITGRNVEFVTENLNALHEDLIIPLEITRGLETTDELHTKFDILAQYYTYRALMLNENKITKLYERYEDVSNEVNQNTDVPQTQTVNNDGTNSDLLRTPKEITNAQRGLIGAFLKKVDTFLFGGRN